MKNVSVLVHLPLKHHMPLTEKEQNVVIVALVTWSNVVADVLYRMNLDTSEKEKTSYRLWLVLYR